MALTMVSIHKRVAINAQLNQLKRLNMLSNNKAFNPKCWRSSKFCSATKGFNKYTPPFPVMALTSPHAPPISRYLSKGAHSL